MPWVSFGDLAIAVLAAEQVAGERVPADDALELRDRWEDARVAFHRSLDGDGAFAALASNARLTVPECEVLAVAAACELDGRRQRLVAALQGDTGPARLSLDTVNRVAGEGHPGARVLGPDGALRRCALVSLLTDGPWSDHRVVVEPTVVWALIGDGGRDPDLPDDLTVVSSSAAGRADLTTVTGPDPLRRRQVAADVTNGERFLVSGRIEGERGWAAVVREATIAGCGVIVEVDGDVDPVGQRWMARADHVSWAVSSPVELPVAQLPRRPWVAVEAPDDEPSDEEWARHLGDTERVHRLNLQQLDHVGRAVDAYGGDLDAAVRRLVSGRLERLARRVRPTRGWADLVLTPDRLTLLRSVVERYRYADIVYDEWGFDAVPSRGLVALFSGPSGTGKTLATEIVAGELGLDVFKLDLSSVVSKYIGETEKNLEEVFDAASAGNLLLFFDEADAIFGKRSEVKDARDRYANIEVSYLLQRLEAYDGLVVLATNFERNVDEAFLRRIHVRVEFAMPGVDERRAIWDRNLPPSAPVKDVDTTWLATRFELSGGAIRNAAVHAAFLAAAEGTSITMECVVRGVVRELRKVGRLLKPSEFDPFADVLLAELGRPEE